MKSKSNKAYWLKCLLGAIILASTAKSSAQLLYDTNSDGTINITGYTTSGGNLNIPSSINNRTVSSIGDYAFLSSSFSSIILPDSLQTIGDGAFQSCGSLISINIPANVDSIGNGPFVNCSSLATISVASPSYYYASVGGVLFSLIPFTQNLDSLVQYPAQENGYTTTNYAIPNSVTSIGDFAFSGTYSLTNVEIGTNVTSIGTGAFSDTGLWAITVDPNNLAYSSVNGILFDKSQATLLFYPENEFGVYALPANVTSVADYAFDYCPLSNITLDNNLTNIGNYAFLDCIHLTSLTIPASVASLGNYVFAYSGLTNITFLGNAPEVGTALFIGVPSFPVYYSPGTTGWEPSFSGLPTVAQYPVYPFSYTTNSGAITITRYTGSGGAVTIPASIDGYPVTSIGADAFEYCINLTSVTIPDSVTSIGEWAFDGCTILTSITIPNSVTNIGKGAFDECTILANLTIPNNVTTIEPFTFEACTSLSSVAIPNSVTTIGLYTFAFCTSLTNITFLGNPPMLQDPTEFPDDNVSATAVYYYYGTSGWSSTFGGLPTVGLFAPPQISAVGNNVGIQSASFNFAITGVSGQTVVVEASTDLVHWQPVWTNTLSGTSATFADPQWKQYPGRFYRAH